jgi:hypothetical protein
MKHSWVPYVAIAAGTAYLTKMVLIFGTDDTAPDLATAVCWFAGLILGVTAAIGYGLRQRRGRRALIAVGGAVLLVAWVLGLGDITSPVFEQVSDASYAPEELPLGLLGVVLLALGALSRGSGRELPTAATTGSAA